MSGAVRPCFLCSGEVESAMESESFNEESAFVICHILEVPHWESVTTRSKFKQTAFCPPCKVKIKGIRHTLEELAALEKIVLDRKIEVEEQLRKSWEERRRRQDTGVLSLDPVDEFRDQILTEISSTKLLSTLTRLRENKIGRRFTRSRRVSENRECEEEVNNYVDTPETSSRLQMQTESRIPSRIVTKVTPSASSSGSNANSSLSGTNHHLYSKHEPSASISTSIFEDPNDRTGFMLSRPGPGSSHPTHTHTPTFPHSSNLRVSHMNYNLEEDIRGHENSAPSELEDSQQSGQGHGQDENSPDYVYPQEVCDVKFDPYATEMEHQQFEAESAESAVSIPRNESNDSSLFVNESEAVGLGLPMSFQIPPLTSSSLGSSMWSPKGRKSFKRPLPQALTDFPPMAMGPVLPPLDKKKRVSLTLQEKFQIVQRIEAGAKQSEVCEEENIPKSTLAGIWKNKDKIVHHFEEFKASTKRVRKLHFEEIDSALFEWFKVNRSNNIPVNARVLVAQAQHYALLFGKPDFKASQGWLDKWKKRHEIAFRALGGEAETPSADDSFGGEDDNDN